MWVGTSPVPAPTWEGHASARSTLPPRARASGPAWRGTGTGPAWHSRSSRQQSAASAAPGTLPTYLPTYLRWHELLVRRGTARWSALQSRRRRQQREPQLSHSAILLRALTDLRRKRRADRSHLLGPHRVGLDVPTRLRQYRTVRAKTSNRRLRGLLIRSACVDRACVVPALGHACVTSAETPTASGAAISANTTCALAVSPGRTCRTRRAAGLAWLRFWHGLALRCLEREQRSIGARTRAGCRHMPTGSARHRPAAATSAPGLR